MSSPHDQFPSLSALLREGLGEALAPGAETLLDMMTDDVSFEFPFSVPGGIEIIDGKAALEAYLPKVGELFTIEALTLERAFVSSDGHNGVLEFTSKAYANATGARYDQTYVSVVDLRDGLISRYKDYWNPLVVLSATGGADAVNSVLKGANADA
ncbi:nuclear transport factor 2 family protein [Acuticoccus sp. M5D2P5]|uniref:nuclear transport factor 2 family protein n=1 Tax=Acuticoccus kalidii TaxID=2910977 RepID=UPI001F1E2E76|nr:nuclear transport factor 2 family protein [Acuticoccus kalidii]MCF3934065.1 nuclear transport factor 2 family protein [Acuticoccus kalidii]